MKTIMTLVRIQDNNICVSHSFSKMDDKAVKTIRDCIEEDMEDDIYFPKEEIDECFTPSFHTIREDYKDLSNCGINSVLNGNCIWETGYEPEDTRYVIHLSILD